MDPHSKPCREGPDRCRSSAAPNRGPEGRTRKRPEYQRTRQPSVRTSHCTRCPRGSRW
jgi:hypothetical protein